MDCSWPLARTPPSGQRVFYAAAEAIMTNFARALNKGISLAAKQAAEPVTYRRGTTTASIRGMRGAKISDHADTSQNSSVQLIRLDWIFPASQINLPAGKINPIEGDEIIDSLGTIYRVAKDPNDGKCARIMPHQVGMRIHTIIVSGEQ